MTAETSANETHKIRDRIFLFFRRLLTFVLLMPKGSSCSAESTSVPAKLRNGLVIQIIEQVFLQTHSDVASRKQAIGDGNSLIAVDVAIQIGTSPSILAVHLAESRAP